MNNLAIGCTAVVALFVGAPPAAEAAALTASASGINASDGTDTFSLRVDLTNGSPGVLPAVATAQITDFDFSSSTEYDYAASFIDNLAYSITSTYSFVSFDLIRATETETYNPFPEPSTTTVISTDATLPIFFSITSDPLEPFPAYYLRVGNDMPQFVAGTILTSVPLPAAMPLFGAGIALVGALGYATKRRSSFTPA